MKIEECFYCFWFLEAYASSSVFIVQCKQIVRRLAVGRFLRYAPSLAGESGFCVAKDERGLFLNHWRTFACSTFI